MMVDVAHGRKTKTPYRENVKRKTFGGGFWKRRFSQNAITDAGNEKQK